MLSLVAQTDGYIRIKKRQKCKFCVIRNGGMGHEFALELLLVGIKVLNHPKIIKYILYFKTVSLTNMYSMCPLLLSNRKMYT